MHSSTLLAMQRVLAAALVLLGMHARGHAELPPGPSLPLTLACSPQNDLFVTLKAMGRRPSRCASPAQAVARASPGSAVLLLADAYPTNALALSAPDFAEARRKELRLYLEFPSFVPGVDLGPPRKTAWERFVVRADSLGSGLPPGRILMAHDCHVLPANISDPLVVVARVAGYDTAVYGIPADAQPVLFTLDDGRLLVATTKLSAFVTGRFAPLREWAALWAQILTRLTGAAGPEFRWTPTVAASYGPEAKLPRHLERHALDRVARWIFDSQLLLTESRWETVRPLLLDDQEFVAAADGPSGEGRFGILEGFSANILHDGTQPQRTPIRADCQAESAAVLALHGALQRNARNRRVAANLLDFLYFDSDLCAGPRGNPEHPAFGHIAWGSTARAWRIANYGDDNARAMLATMLVSATLGTNRWDEPLMRALLANLRTTGPQGFRGDRIDLATLERHGWKHFHDTERVNLSPHFESYNWACFLWAWRQTGHREFLDRTKNGIQLMMEGYPDQWRWNDNMERARMLLCLAWLVRLEDTPEHRSWLRRVVDDLLAIQHPCGAFPERFRGSAASHYRIPASNDAYGTDETPLIQRNGDPVSDQLYVSGFALLGLHEAAAVLGDARVNLAEDKLAEYLCRIQTRSRKRPQLNGTWFRAFDFERWEPWASSGDAGWGAWSLESGWAQAWTAITLGLRERKTTFWEVTAQSGVRECWLRVTSLMARNSGGPWVPPPPP